METDKKRVSVPIEPTQEMIDAAEATTTLANNFCEADLIDIYKAMVLEWIKRENEKSSL